jgi:enoyl-CoA hydratase/carnithine racemase
VSDVIAPQVRRERDGRVARVVIGSGTRRNALTSGGWAGIERAVTRLADDDAVRVVVIEGNGGWFSAGSDIREWAGASADRVDLSFARMEAACAAIEQLPVAVIAKVRGVAAGAGCQLALACDLRFLAGGASIGMPIARLGILVSPSFANRLAAGCGAAVAAELLFTGRMVRADEAVKLGLANGTVPADALDDHVEVVIERIIAVSAASVRAAKRALARTATPGRVAARATGGKSFNETDFRSGVAAFIARAPTRSTEVAG